MRDMDDGELSVETYDDLLPAIADAIKKVPPAPCDDCIHAVLCALEPLACVAFYEYSRSQRGRYNPDAPRMPTNAIYNQVFGVGRVRL